MLFKYSNDSFPIDPLYKKTASQFSFKELNDLIYIAEPLENEFKNLEKKIDNRIYPDLIAAIYRKMYEGSLVLRGTFANALLACSYHLQNSKYKFIAFMRGDEELRKDVPDIDFVKSWNFKKNFYNLADQSPSYISKTKIHEIFQQEDFNNAYNLFFIAGCQSFEMLDMRIKKAVNAISQLLNSKINSIDNVHVLLSGWNNSKAANSKIQFANESLVMQNLLILKFTNQLGKELPNDFVNNQIGVDVSSGA